MALIAASTFRPVPEPLTETSRCLTDERNFLQSIFTGCLNHRDSEEKGRPTAVTRQI
jgi:hypothetical protein